MIAICLALVDATVIDGTGATLQTGVTVVICGGRIAVVIEHED